MLCNLTEASCMYIGFEGLNKWKKERYPNEIYCVKVGRFQDFSSRVCVCVWEGGGGVVYNFCQGGAVQNYRNTIPFHFQADVSRFYLFY